MKQLRWGFWAAIAITLLSLYPQLLMWRIRGAEWNGSYAEIQGDEWLYSAYIQALIDGRPRRNDPYTGRDDRPNQTQPESLFSIQFVPAYVIAVSARLIGISSSTAFLALGILGPLLAYCSIFWLLATLIKDYRLAADGAILVLCLGGLAAGQGLIHLFSSGYQYSFLPFLRRYEPSTPFPLFFVFCGFVWRSLHSSNRSHLWAWAAGLVLAILIFSYFYLWTSALAWLACLAILLLIAYPENFRKYYRTFLIIFLMVIAALIPYGVLLSRRSAQMDSGQKLMQSHAPDLFRVPELFGAAVITLVIFGWVQGRVSWRDERILFAASFSLMPFVVFNQQVVTGLSLQPYHYESLIANYVVLTSAVMTISIYWRGSGRESRRGRRSFGVPVMLAALWWAAIEVVLPTNVLNSKYQLIDRAAPVCKRLRDLAVSDNTMQWQGSEANPRPLVLATVNKVAIILPTFAPQAVLWASHFDFLHLEPGESRERFYKYLYYTGVGAERLEQELNRPQSTFAAAAFGHERAIPYLSVEAKPITAEEIALQVADYQRFLSSFNRETAADHLLSYVIAPASGADLSNLDQWYQRNEGERVGDFILYRVELRP